MKPRLLDLFCGAGGVSAGYVRAGFEVVGVDLSPQPNYPYTFIQADALSMLGDERLLREFGAIHASPPCQHFTAYKRRPSHVKPCANLIPETRAGLIASKLPYVIENVPGAPLLAPIVLCGSMFGLDVRRHRLFETSFGVVRPACRHHEQTPRFAQATNRKNLRSTVEVGVYRIPLAVQRKAMGIDWMTLGELSQAIPPAYTEFLGLSLLRAQRKAG